MRLKLGLAAFAASMTLAGGAAQAAVVTFMGYDEGASTPGANATAAQTAFLAATNLTSVVDFESPTLPAGVSLATGGMRLNTPVGAPQYWGDNTTPGGTWHLGWFIGTTTFSFASGIDAFGLYVGGLQFPNTLSWTDSNGLQSISLGGVPSNGGFAFIGFSDVGESITSVSITSDNDVNGLDDVYYGVANGGGGGVPEPETWGLMIGGLGLAGASLRRRRMAVSA